MPPDAHTLIAINAVRGDRVEEFERWLRSVVVPAIRDQRPDLDGQWQVLRATEADPDDAVVFAFVCQGGVPEDWDLLPVLEQALGRAEADRALDTFAGMLRGEQQSWFFTPFEAERP